MPKFNLGHLKSQKFAGFVFSVFVCFMAGVVQVSEASTQAVVMGIVALYTAFVGGRTWSDNAALKFGGTVGTPDNPPPAKPAVPVTTVVKKIVATPPKKDEEVD